jgi:hypothetical protein
MTRHQAPDGTRTGSSGPFAVALVLSLGIAAVATVVALARGSFSHPSTASTPQLSPAPSPSPLAIFPVHPPPQDRQLLWFGRRSEQIATAVRLHATDWDGHEVGTLAVGCLAPCWFKQSPDGQRLLVGPFLAEDAPGHPADIFDASGRHLGTVDGLASAVWADDSRHVCTLRALNPSAPRSASPIHVELELAAPGAGPPRSVAEVGVSIAVDSGSWNVAACSIAADRAVLSLSGDVEHAVRVVELSSGRTLYSRDDQTQPGTCACPVSNMVVSHDGTVAVENLSLGGLRFLNLSTGATTPGPAGLSAQTQVLGLSWNGRRALTSAGVFDVPTGRLLWLAPATAVGLSAERPGSDDVLVFVSAPSTSDRLAIVRGDGSAMVFAYRYQ